MRLSKMAGAVVFLAVLAGGNPIFAAPVGSMTSQADVTFVENTDPVSPVDPTEPTKPVRPVDPTDPTDPHEPGTAGPLSLDYVSNFHFGQQKISGSDITYYAQLDKVKDPASSAIIEVPNYVQVTDSRGTNAGWKLKVKQNGQFKTPTNAELKNAQLELMNPYVSSVTKPEYAPTAKVVTLNPAGIEHDVTIADANKGMGTWTTAYGKNKEEGKQSVTLFVPLTSQKEKGVQYSTTLTWVLEDTPN